MKNASIRVLVLLCSLAAVLAAQNISGALLGTVTDPSGSPVPTAAVELTSQTTGEHMSAASNPEGLFRFPIVPPDRYQLTIRANGFKAHAVADIELASSETRDMGRIAMELGSLQETVTVEATATPVQTASSEKSALVTGQELNSIALKGRDFFGLMYTLPGVVDTSTTRDATSPNAISGITINGGRNASKNFTVDGISDMDTGSNTTVHYEPNMDAIAEVKVLTSNYQAEFGRNSGGTISAITKGGTQDFHGSGWFQHRNEDMNANLWANNLNGLPRAPYRLGIEGYTIGGPIYVPHHFNTDKHRLFFFVSEEWTGQKINSSPSVGNMPTALERNGNFSQSYDTSGALIVVNDPTTGKPFPGNVIPSSRISPVGQAVLNFFPTPNYPTADPSLIYQENYAATPLATHTRRNDVVRVDYNVTSKLTAYFRWINDHDETLENNHDVTNFVGPEVSHPNPGHGYAGHLLWTISPTLVNETTVGRSYNTWDWYAVNGSQWNRSQMGNIPKWFPINNSLGDQENYIPDLSFGGTPINTPSLTPDDMPYYNANNIYTATDNVSKVVGSHSLKAGVYFERNQKIEDQEVAAWLGNYSFSTDANNPFDSGNSYANALLGNYDTYTETNDRLIQRVWFTDLEFYFQDNWRVSKRLTLDIGLRFYHVTPQADQHDAFAAFDPALYSAAQAPVLYQPAKVNGTRVAMNPLTGQTYPAAYIGLFVPGTGNPADGAVIGGQNGVPHGLYAPPALTPGPRFGFAWDVFGNGRTAVRGGIGMFEDTIDGNPSMNMSGNPPISYTPTSYYGNVGTLTQSGQLLGPSSILYLFGNQIQPRTVSYSLGVQQAVGLGAVLDVSYVGSFSRHLLFEQNINPIPIGAHFAAANQDPTQSGKPLPDTFLVPYVGWSNLMYEEFAGTANYNSLQVTLNRRFSHGLMFGGSYTYSKALGEANSETGAVSAYFSPRQRNYQPLSFNRAQVLAVNYSYDFPRLNLPGGKVTSAVVNGWTFSGITSATTGAPLTPSFSLSPTVDITGSSTGSSGDSARMNLTCNPASGTKTGTSAIFNASCFQMPAVGSFGDAGLGYLTGPGYMNWDMALAKKIPVGLGEKRQLQFRGEAYNTFNHTEYNALNSAIRFNSKTGVISNLTSGLGNYTGTRPARIMALSLRFQF
jgi:Carboxypeptidase regulatory-like domain